MKKMLRFVVVVLLIAAVGSSIRGRICNKQSTEPDGVAVSATATASNPENIESAIRDELKKEMNLDENDPLQKAILDSVDVVVEKLDGNTAKCKLSNIDVSAVMDYVTEHAKDIGSRVDFAEVLSDAIKAAPRVESDVDIDLTQGVDGNLHVSFSKDQLEAATGFLSKYYSKIMENDKD